MEPRPRHRAADALGERALLRRGKVREVYDLGSLLLIVATDRISAFDRVLPTPVPGRGIVLTALSRFWFERTAPVVPNHMVSTDLCAIAEALDLDPAAIEHLAGRAMLCRRAQRIDFECVVRGYLAGSAWREYEETGRVCGIELAPGLHHGARLPRPIFTPATKAESGHDENVPFERLQDALGDETAQALRRHALAVYDVLHDHAWSSGLVLADTKMEFGWIEGELRLIDELGTPDSSRYWERAGWEREGRTDSFDKQLLRDWLARRGWRGEGPAPALPSDLVCALRERYLEVYRRLTGAELELPEAAYGEEAE